MKYINPQFFEQQFHCVVCTALIPPDKSSYKPPSYACGDLPDTARLTCLMNWVAPGVKP
jgi:hypothetical protein